MGSEYAKAPMYTRVPSGPKEYQQAEVTVSSRCALCTKVPLLPLEAGSEEANAAASGGQSCNGNPRMARPTPKDLIEPTDASCQ